MRAGRIINELAPEVLCSLSSDVLPEVREYERTSTTVINAYVRPIVDRYLRSLLRGIQEIGVRAPVRIMQSNGGIQSARSAMLRPVHLVESGPAAGVVAARLLAARAGVPSAIAFDMGGTTAKASLIEEGRTRVTSEFEVGARLSAQGLNLAGGGYAMKIPVLDIAEVGAGGGSIVWIDRGGSLQIGPRSAGAEPGPACYGLGGEEPTVTDANVVLGYLNPRYLAGGSVPIDAARARRAIEERVARPLGLGVEESAWAAHVVSSARMIAGIKAVTTQRGRDPRESVLIAFGGNGPVHAAGMARLLEIRRVIVPPSPGLFSAFGLLYARHERHVVQTYYRPVDAVDPDHLDAALRALEAGALAEMHSDGYERERVRSIRGADLRYVGQGFELTVPLEGGRLDAAKLSRLAELFRQEHHRTYGHRSDDDPVQIVNLRLTVFAGEDELQRPTGCWWDDRRGAGSPGATREVHFGGGAPVACPVLRRADLDGAGRAGPLIVEEYDATTVVPPSCAAALDPDGNIVLEIEEA